MVIRLCVVEMLLSWTARNWSEGTSNVTLVDFASYVGNESIVANAMGNRLHTLQ